MLTLHDTRFHYNLNTRNILRGLFAIAIAYLYLKKGRLYLRTGFVKIYNNLLKGSYKATLMVCRSADEVDAKQAAIKLSTLKKMLFRYSRLYKTLEKINFLNNPQTKEIAEKTLSLLFESEFKTRQKAFACKDVSEEEQDLREFASSVSLRSIHYSE